jgi:hypothetical protein
VSHRRSSGSGSRPAAGVAQRLHASSPPPAALGAALVVADSRAARAPSRALRGRDPRGRARPRDSSVRMSTAPPGPPRRGARRVVSASPVSRRVYRLLDRGKSGQARIVCEWAHADRGGQDRGQHTAAEEERPASCGRSLSTVRCRGSHSPSARLRRPEGRSSPSRATISPPRATPRHVTPRSDRECSRGRGCNRCSPTDSRVQPKACSHAGSWTPPYARSRLTHGESGQSASRIPSKGDRERRAVRHFWCEPITRAPSSQLRVAPRATLAPASALSCAGGGPGDRDAPCRPLRTVVAISRPPSAPGLDARADCLAAGLAVERMPRPPAGRLFAHPPRPRLAH